MNGAEHDTRLFVEIANAPTATQRERIAAQLATNADGETPSGIGLDGRALELVSAILDADGELYTDGECLDVIGRIVDIWRATDLDA
jgi:hypothetical protein